MNVGIVLILVAFVMTLIEALNLMPHQRVHWGWLGVTFWLASLVVGGARLL